MDDFLTIQVTVGLQSLMKKKKWLQVDLGKVFQVCAVATQGGNHHKKYRPWTTAFKLLYSTDDKNRKTYKDGDGEDMVS